MWDRGGSIVGADGLERLFVCRSSLLEGHTLW